MISPSILSLLVPIVFVLFVLASSIRILREVRARRSLHAWPLCRRQGARPDPDHSRGPTNGTDRPQDTRFRRAATGCHFAGQRLGEG